MASSTTFRAGTTALVRAVARPELPVSPCPDLNDLSPYGEAARLAWLREVWSDEDVAEALEHASPVLASQVRALCSSSSPAARDVRRAVSSVARYVLRAEQRATPFGLFAGVALAAIGSRARSKWGSDHVVIGRSSAEWLTAVVERLESCPELLARLAVVVNNTATRRGDRLIVPYKVDAQGDRRRAVEASVALTEPVRVVLEAAREPICAGALADKLVADFPGAGPGKARRLVEGLIRNEVLITSLHAPSTETDALDYLLAQLDAVEADAVTQVADTIRELRAVQADLRDCGSRSGRGRAAARMRALVSGLRRHPLALDLCLDAEVELPQEAAREVERAVGVLARVSALPYGTAAWKAYQRRFYERYGIGTMVPLTEVVADSGTGFPDGYPGAPSDGRRSRLSARDDTLVRLAQAAVLDGRDEVVLTDELIAAMDLGPESPRVPPHLEVGVRVHAASTEELQRGRFRLEVASVSRGIGVTTGRFLGVLAPEDRGRLSAELADLRTADDGTVPAQLSFPPMLPTSAHVTRAPQVLSTVISVQEHRSTSSDVLTPDDLAVACDGRRMYLAAPVRGQRIEAVGMHALNLKEHTPPLVRFLTELSRAQCAQVTLFNWGAATAMPFLPRLRYGRTILAPARWRLEGSNSPAATVPRSGGTPLLRSGGPDGGCLSGSPWPRRTVVCSSTSTRPPTGPCCASISTAPASPSSLVGRRRLRLVRGPRARGRRPPQGRTAPGMAAPADPRTGPHVLSSADPDARRLVPAAGHPVRRPPSSRHRPRPAHPRPAGPTRQATMVVHPLPRPRPPSPGTHRPVRSRSFCRDRPHRRHLGQRTAHRRAAVGHVLPHLLPGDGPLGLRHCLGRR